MGEASNLLKYVQGTPAIEITNKSDLPQIQLIGDFSGVDDDELAVVLAFEPNNYIFVANTSILDMDLDHGVKISKAYDFDKSTGIFNLSENVLKLVNNDG